MMFWTVYIQKSLSICKIVSYWCKCGGVQPFVERTPFLWFHGEGAGRGKPTLTQHNLCRVVVMMAILSYYVSEKFLVRQDYCMNRNTMEFLCHSCRMHCFPEVPFIASCTKNHPCKQCMLYRILFREVSFPEPFLSGFLFVTWCIPQIMFSEKNVVKVMWCFCEHNMPVMVITVAHKMLSCVNRVGMMAVRKEWWGSSVVRWQTCKIFYICAILFASLLVPQLKF